jgi:hypothetical protein
MHEFARGARHALERICDLIGTARELGRQFAAAILQRQEGESGPQPGDAALADLARGGEE